jgi:hypothetical protein
MDSEGIHSSSSPSGIKDDPSYGFAYTQDPGIRYDSEDFSLSINNQASNKEKGSLDIFDTVGKEAGKNMSRALTIDSVIAAVEDVFRGNDF